MMTCQIRVLFRAPLTKRRRLRLSQCLSFINLRVQELTVLPSSSPLRHLPCQRLRRRGGMLTFPKAPRCLCMTVTGFAGLCRPRRMAGSRCLCMKATAFADLCQPRRMAGRPLLWISFCRPRRMACRRRPPARLPRRSPKRRARRALRKFLCTTVMAPYTTWPSAPKAKPASRWI